MFGKVNSDRGTKSTGTPSPETYRALIRPIRVKNHAKRRTLEEILQDPPEFPALRDPEKDTPEVPTEKSASANEI